jgi:LEA14-like dessication related protein
MTRRWGLVLVIGLMGGMIAGCTSVEERLALRKPSAQLVDVQLKDASVYGATLAFDVAIENHYPVDLPLLRFDYDLSSNGRRLFAGSQDLTMTVPAGGSRTVSLPARVDYLAALKALANVRPGAKIPYIAQVSLIINTPQLGSITLPLARSGELALPELPGADVNSLLGTTRTE